MSWFSELASKAEAMLVQLDQDAAQALQTDGSIRDTKILGQAINTISTYRDKLRTPIAEDKVQLDINEADLKTTASDPIGINEEQSSSGHLFGPSSGQIRAESQTAVPNNAYSAAENSISTTTNASEPNSVLSVATTAIIHNDDSNNSNNDKPTLEMPVIKYPRKFTIQKSSSASRTFATNRQYPDKRILIPNQNNIDGQASEDNCLGADDIRASINRSLQECSIQSYSSPSVHQTSYASHFDDQPNLVDQSYHIDNDRASTRLLSPPYFSLELPEERSSGSASGEIASRLLKQGAMKKKSSFYLHQVISKLASSNRRSSLIDSDKMKIRVRRAQLRLTSYARRMNYYFRTYPMIKYFILVYLALIQLLIVYVLFFYQSSSSSTTDLSSQIKQQETESKIISEIHPVDGNLHPTSLN